MRNAPIFWFTGLSGTGKTTLSSHAKKELETYGLSTKVLDGDAIRANYKQKLGFGRKDIEKNNMNIVKLCQTERKNYDIVMVPIISPINQIREIARKNLEPFFYLIYLSSSMSALKKRDPKGLYSKADKGEISNLIGYSKTNRYEVPDNADLKLDTSSSETIYLSVEIIVDFIKKNSNKTNFSL